MLSTSDLPVLYIVLYATVSPLRKSRVGKSRLTVFPQQVCPVLSPNRTYISQCIRLCYRLVSIESLVMNRNMAFSANDQRLTALCNHYDFPGLFTL